MRATLLPLVLLGAAGCDELGDVLGIAPPEAVLKAVDLLDAPSSGQLLGYSCAQTLGAALCEGVGLEEPTREQLAFSFDVVFDLTNPNPLPIPLVETLLGFSAFDEDNLGSVCVTFCDPSDAACEPLVDAKGACDPEGATHVFGAEDLDPTISGLVHLADDATVEGALDNADWRVVTPYGTTESHLQFELGIDPLLRLADDLLGQAVGDVFSGRSPAFEVPYVVEGTLFFDVPSLGRHAVGFGPVSDEWKLR